MKTHPELPVRMAVVVVPDQITLHCQACREPHELTRGLDFDARADGRYALSEVGGFACDCGVRIQADFRVVIEPRTME